MSLSKVDMLLHHHPRAVMLTGLAAVGVPWLLNNYRQFRALGQTRLKGPLGWFVALMLTAFGRETVSTAEYDKAATQERWLETPVERRGTRPVTGWHCVPHRQTNRLPSDEMAKRLDAIFEKHAAANPTLVQTIVSPHEKNVLAMVIHSDVPSPHKDAVQGLREIGHIHRIDHSMHIILSPADSKTAIDLGWAERHPLSGVNPFFPFPNNYLPSNYLLVYAPRDKAELDVVERILVASIGYMTGSRSVA
ncbi:hypothetical protein MSAN_00386100 [Mycena sanguinolenta]|uniref:Luciferase domain-containing protein n=1 Tax=Mycena sanguinolenta TaxID=230812 RepID=A0A8H6Z9H9_9AGAR|nr:hypothetical protein MSAN_00386100 [Mycena sanguinolenta]